MPDSDRFRVLQIQSESSIPVLGDDMGDNSDAIDKWLAEQADDADGFFVLGDTSGGGDLSLAVQRGVVEVV